MIIAKMSLGLTDFWKSDETSEFFLMPSSWHKSYSTPFHMLISWFLVQVNSHLISNKWLNSGLSSYHHCSKRLEKKKKIQTTKERHKHSIIWGSNLALEKLIKYQHHYRPYLCKIHDTNKRLEKCNVWMASDKFFAGF